MITTESARFACDSCGEVNEGKMIVVTDDNIDVFIQSLQLCGNCVDNLKRILQMDEIT